MKTSPEKSTVAIALSTYNEERRIDRCLTSCLTQRTRHTVRVIVCDDGSIDNTAASIRSLQSDNPLLEFTQIGHQERGVARGIAVDAALTYQPDFLFIIDADMFLPDDLVENCVSFLSNQRQYGALVIPELAFSSYTNYWTQVKVFERNLIGNAGERYEGNSIEAARFWRLDAYHLSGGLNTTQIAFEDIQPSLRFTQKGGQIARASFTYLQHDEKHITLKSLVQKKSYYFSKLPATVATEKHGLCTMLSRWYFFRPVLYQPGNIRRCLARPDLALGVFLMYWLLTFIAIYQAAISWLKTFVPAKGQHNYADY